MRRIIVVEFISLDGVIQAPGGPDEDKSGEFKFGGWLAPFSDETLGEALNLTYGRPYDLLLGRNTYNIFSAYWPHVKPKDEMTKKFQDDFNACTKFVATHSPETLSWNNSESLGTDIVQKIKQIREASDRTLLVIGSSELAHILFAHDLVDEMHLMTAPIVLGKGKRLFDENSKPVAYMLNRATISKKDMIMTILVRDGDIQTGTMED